MAKERDINRQYIFEKMDTLLNPAEKFLVLGLYEGIGANTKIGYSDFADLTLDNFDTELHKLRLTNRMITYSNELYELAKESADTYENIVYDKNGNERRVRLSEDNRIIKPACNAKTDDYRNIISKKIRKIKEAFENPSMTMQTLKESGRREMINKLISEGKTEDEAMEDEEMLNTYGNLPGKKRYKLNYYAE